MFYVDKGGLIPPLARWKYANVEFDYPLPKVSFELGTETLVRGPSYLHFQVRHT